MLRIRLRRMAGRHRPCYRIVVSDSRKVPTSQALEELGYYDPSRSPKVLKLNTDRVDYWVKRGATPSATVAKLVKKASAGAPTEPTTEAAPAAAGA